MFESEEMFEPDWNKIQREAQIARKLLEEKFLDEDNGEYEVIDYWTPPEEGDEATCDFCQAKHHAGDMEGMLEHLLDEHIDKIKLEGED